MSGRRPDHYEVAGALARQADGVRAPGAPLHHVETGLGDEALDTTPGQRLGVDHEHGGDAPVASPVHHGRVRGWRMTVEGRGVDGPSVPDRSPAEADRNGPRPAERGSPGTRTQNLRVKSPLLCQLS